METETPDGQESSASPPTYIWWPLQDGEVYLVAGKPAEHWVLDLVGAFASLQDGIELILAMYPSTGRLTGAGTPRSDPSAVCDSR